MSLSKNQIKKYVVDPIGTGIAAAGFIGLAYGTGSVPFIGGREISGPAAFFCIAVGADIAGTVIADAISTVNTIEELDEFQRMAIKPLVSGVMMVPMAYYLVSPSTTTNMAKIAGIGVLSNITGNYLGEMVGSTY